MKGWRIRACLIEDSRRDQGGIGYLVGALPLFKGQAPLPPAHVLMLADNATLQTTSTMQAKTRSHRQRSSYEVCTHALFVQFHGDVPVEGPALAVVARPQVLPDPMIPGSGHQRRLRKEPCREDLDQLISLPKLEKYRAQLCQQASEQDFRKRGGNDSLVGRKKGP